MPIATKSGKLILKDTKVATTCSCCGCSEECCRTETYSYMDTEPKGKWYDECPNVGQCGGEAGSCANAVLEGFIVERFCKSSIEGKQVRAKLRANSAIDDFGSVAGIETDQYCGRLGVISGDHDITGELVIEDDPEDSNYKRYKVPFRAVNANHGGPYGLSSVTICWCCINDGDPPCSCCATEPPPPPPKKYKCLDGACVETTSEGKYDEPTCGGQCGDDFQGNCCTEWGLVYVSRGKCREWGGTFQEPGDASFECDCSCNGIGGDFSREMVCTQTSTWTTCNGEEGGYCSKYNGYQASFFGYYPSFPSDDPDGLLDDIREQGAQIIGWIDIASSSAVAPGTQEFTRCCLLSATRTIYKYRTFALNCKTKTYVEVANILSKYDFDSTGGYGGTGATCNGQTILASEDPVPPTITIVPTAPTCLPFPQNPLP